MGIYELAMQVALDPRGRCFRFIFKCPNTHVFMNPENDNQLFLLRSIHNHLQPNYRLHGNA
jgi:hypothetical protein